jgi:hypothetical protein
MVSGLLGLAINACHKDDCSQVLNPNQSIEVTVVAHESESMVGCPMKVAPAPGDKFIVTPSSEFGDDTCSGNSLTGQRPAFVPEAYGTCRGSGIAQMECGRGGEPSLCPPLVEIAFKGLQSAEGRGTINVLSSQCLEFPEGCDAGCAPRYGNCGDIYSVTFRPVD